MQTYNLRQAYDKCQEMLIDELYNLVSEYGEPMTAEMREQIGYEEDEGWSVTKALDISSFGCCFARQNKLNDPFIDKAESLIDLEKCFTNLNILVLFIVQNNETKATEFWFGGHVSRGVKWLEDLSNPVYREVCDLDLAELSDVIKAVEQNCTVITDTVTWQGKQYLTRTIRTPNGYREYEITVAEEALWDAIGEHVLNGDMSDKTALKAIHIDNTIYYYTDRHYLTELTDDALFRIVARETDMTPDEE